MPRRNGISHLTQPPSRPRPSAQPNNKSKPPPRTRPPGPYRSRHFGWKSNGKSRGQVPAASSRKQARAHRQRRPWRGRADAEAAVCRMEGRMGLRHGRIPRGGRPMAISWEVRGARPTAARAGKGRAMASRMESRRQRGRGTPHKEGLPTAAHPPPEGERALSRREGGTEQAATQPQRRTTNRQHNPRHERIDLTNPPHNHSAFRSRTCMSA